MKRLDAPLLLLPLVALLFGSCAMEEDEPFAESCDDGTCDESAEYDVSQLDVGDNYHVPAHTWVTLTKSVTDFDDEGAIFKDDMYLNPGDSCGIDLNGKLEILGIDAELQVVEMKYTTKENTKGNPCPTASTFTMHGSTTYGGGFLNWDCANGLLSRDCER